MHDQRPGLRERQALRRSARTVPRTRAATAAARTPSARAGSAAPSRRPRRAAPRRLEVVTWKRRPAAAPRPAHASNPRSSVAGPHSHRSAPAAVSVQMFERATREWSTSPRITTLRPSSDASPRCARIVYRSSSAWVGWACQPSPPLSTEPPKTSAARYGAPDTEWRIDEHAGRRAPRSSGSCRPATRPSTPTRSTPRCSRRPPRGSWPRPRTRRASASRPRRTGS